MESEAAATLDFVVSQTWKCLSVPTRKQDVFPAVFFDEDILFETATAANITFAPGLLDVVQSPNPPDISFFKTLPTKSLGLWGVYSLVLEKSGCIPAVYVGEASEVNAGISFRWKHYGNPVKYRRYLPSKVREALDNGYKITHKGVLAWFSIPSAKNVPRFRVLNYSMEVMFGFLFWAMHSKTKDYGGIDSCCPWHRESFTYGGLCSHSAFLDPMRANLNLSAKQLELLDAQNKENRRIRNNIKSKRSKDAKKARDPEGVKQENKDRYARRKAKDPNFYKPSKKKSYDRRKAEDPVAFAAAAAATFQHYYNHPVSGPKMRATAKAGHIRTKADRMASKEFHCDICDRTCINASALQRHFNSERHKKKVAKKAAGVVFKYRCDTCKTETNDKGNWTKHLLSPMHKARLENAAS